MVTESYDRLEILDYSTTDWKIKVRVTRMWAAKSNKTSVCKRYNLILIDDDNYHIHAFVNASKWEKVKKDIKEGSIYIIATFEVYDAIARLRPVSSKMTITFTEDTIVKPVEEDDHLIPVNKFEFVTLDELSNLAYATSQG
ncbi:replication protein A 70 kDa DNA-binding subunit B-like [Apium graveolens]|uniref:replication protein A 70 kDa DNA-binding subunit B-like n=1 Tax=Apium graveolens TaxID=4045 RepID=UPI003D79E45E